MTTFLELINYTNNLLQSNQKTKTMTKTINGFSWGTIFHNAQMAFENDGILTKEAIADIIKQAPPEVLKHARIGGSAIQTASLTEVGYGLQGGRWDAQLQLQKKKQPLTSYLVAAVELYKELRCETMCFTFNTHNPFLGYNDLQESINSLTFVRKGTNVVGVTLGNENYLAAHVIGACGTPNASERINLAGFWGAFSNAKVNKALENKINAYLDYLEFTVVPAIRKSGYTGDIGIDVHNNSAIGFKLWNQCVLNRNFYDFVTPHLYAEGDTMDAILKEFESHVEDLRLVQKRKRIWVTEYGISEKANVKMSTTGEVDIFMRKFNELFNKYGVERSYYHTLWNDRPTIYTYCK